MIKLSLIQIKVINVHKVALTINPKGKILFKNQVEKYQKSH